MTKEEILQYLAKALNNCDSRTMSVSTEQLKDKIILNIQTWDKKEKFAISVKRME